MFVGRDRELDDLTRAAEEAVRGRGSLYLISGEGGMGKTRLASELAARATALGARVVWGRCWEGSGAPPYHPWIEVLRRARPSSTGRPRSLTDLVGELPADGDADRERFELLDRTSGFLAEAAADQPLVIVLDDLQWADVSSLLLLGFLARHVAEDPIMYVGIYRDAELGLDGERSRIIANAARHGRLLQLDGLQTSDIHAYVHAAHDSSISNETAEHLLAITGGNPFFLEETTRVLARDGRLEEASGFEVRVTQGIREMVRARVDSLPVPAQAVLDVAAVVGRRFSVAVVANAAGRAQDDVVSALELAAQAGLIEQVSMPLGVHAFTHDLIRESLYVAFEPRRLAEIHRRVGEALERYYGDGALTRATELAHHFMRAVSVMDGDKAVWYSERAADAALRDLAFEEAAHYLADAHEVAFARGLPPVTRCLMLLRLGDAQLRGGSRRVAVRTFLEAADLARSANDGEMLALAALGVSSASLEHGQHDQQTASVLEEAIDALGDAESALKARLLARLAAESYYTGQRARVKSQSRESVEMARRAGDRPALARVLRQVMWTGLDIEDLTERHEIALETAAMAAELKDRELEFDAKFRLLIDHLEWGDPCFTTELEHMRTLAAESRRPLLAALTASVDACVHHMQGRLAGAERLGRDSYIAQRAAGDPNGGHRFGALLTALRRDDGRLEERIGSIERTVERSPMLTVWGLSLAWMYASVGRREDARDAFERWIATPLRRDDYWLVGMSFLAEAADMLGVCDDRIEQAYEDLCPFGDRYVVIGTASATLGPVEHYLGVLATTLGRVDHAVGHFERAVAMCDRLAARPALAHAKRAHAHATGDGVLAREAVDLYDELGMTWWADQTRERAAIRSSDRSRKEASVEASIAREGDYWAIAWEGSGFRLKDAKGLHYLRHLLANPAREFHVLDLVGTVEGRSSRGGHREPGLSISSGDAGAMLDERAKFAYRSRVEELRADIEEAERFGDVTRVSRAQEELDAIANELARAVGLGGRDRRAASDVERARVNVTRNVRSVIERLGSESPSLGRHLLNSVKTGTYLTYDPDPDRPVDWML